MAGAVTKKKVPDYVTALAEALAQQLPGARVDAERIRGSRYRFIVIWDRFNNVGHPERQRKVWSIADRVVPGERLLDVGMILTIAPGDYPGTDLV